MAAATSTSRAERRRHRRSQTSLIATVNYGRLLLPCVVADLSMGGAKVKLIEPGKLPSGSAVLECARFGKVAADMVWQKGLFAGFRFADPKAMGDLARHLGTPAHPSPGGIAPASPAPQRELSGQRGDFAATADPA